MPGTYSTVVLEGMPFTDGDENTAGIQEDAWFIPFSYFATLAVPVPSTTTASLVEITSDHVMKTGKAPIPLFTQFEKSGLDSPLAGELYSKIFMPVIKLFHPQPNEVNATNLSVIKNQRGIVLIKRTQGGPLIQIGTQGLYAKVKSGTVSFGTGPTGAPGVTFEVEAPSVHPYLVYKGVFPVTGV